MEFFSLNSKAHLTSSELISNARAIQLYNYLSLEFKKIIVKKTNSFINFMGGALLSTFPGER